MRDDEDLVDGSDDFDEEDNIDDMYLTFSVGDEEYGVSIVYVTEVVRLQKVIEVPDVPRFIRGVINLRGTVVPVMDVRMRFGLPFLDYNDRTVIIVLEVDNIPTGLVVDAVREVIEIPADTIDPPPQWVGDASAQSVVRGMGKREDGVSILIDVNHMLDEKEVVLNLPAIKAAEQAVAAEAA